MSAVDEDGKERQLKLVLLGDGTTGKTSIITRLSQNHFGKSYQQTVGLDFFMKRLSLPGGVNVTLQIWDIGGQSIGGRMLENYIYGAHAILLVYDITNYASFENVVDWLSVVKSVCSKAEEPLPHIALVANKVDLEHMRTVRKERHSKFAKESCNSSHSISAKTDDLVSALFMRVSADVVGVRLTNADMERVSILLEGLVSLTTAQTVVKAGIVQYKETPKQKEKEKRTKSSFCVLQ